MLLKYHFFVLPKRDKQNMNSVLKLWMILCFHSSPQRRHDVLSPIHAPVSHSSHQQSLSILSPPMNDHFPYQVHQWMITSSFGVHQRWSITMSKNLWALKTALNLMDTLATQCILFFSLFVSFCNLKSIFRKQTILHVRYVQSNVQTW